MKDRIVMNGTIISEVPICKICGYKRHMFVPHTCDEKIILFGLQCQRCGTETQLYGIKMEE